MKIGRFIDPEGVGAGPRAVLIHNNEVFDTFLGRMMGIVERTDFLELSALAEGPPDWDALRELQRSIEQLEPNEFPEYRYPLVVTPLLAPIQPPSFRDFYAFEAHVRNARRKRGLEMLPEWYEAPAFYFSNAASIVGPGATIHRPSVTKALDFELELSIVISKPGSNIAVTEAEEYIAGFSVLNDWSARDVQKREMRVGLGPAKAKDFATSLGPYIVTPDELTDRKRPDPERGARWDLTMTAFVNGVEYSRGNALDMNWTFAELIAEASRDTILRAGDLIGSGTVGTGCITEFPDGERPWLEPGDEVRLEIDGLGALTNRVV